MTDKNDAETKTAEETADRKDRPVPDERSHSVRGTVTVAGAAIDYTAETGILHLKGDDEDEVRAGIFYTAYTKSGVEDAAARPITFCFNGGPGSSSVWLHMGVFGPRRVDIPDTVQPPPPPYRLVDNDHSLLDLTDLVFIDPVSTGYSRPLGKGEAEEFHTVKGDVESVAEFIRLWVTRKGRWNSPKLLAGESYGTTRGAALAAKLADAGMGLNGLILVSAALSFQTLLDQPGNDLPHALFLPGYAATAWYHDALDRRPEDVQVHIDKAREFAIREYLPALLQGSALPADERKGVIAGLHELTGLSPEWLERNDLRIPPGRFFKALLADRGLVVGRLDSRYTAVDPDPGNSLPDKSLEDPSYTALLAPYTALLQDYLHNELGFSDDRRYEILSMKVNENWKWEIEGGMGYLNVTGELRRTMLANPHLKVLFAAGLYDLATPFFSIEHTAHHLGREELIRNNVSITWYEAGHMMYLHPPSLAKMKSDVTEFFESALTRP